MTATHFLKYSLQEEDLRFPLCFLLSGRKCREILNYLVFQGIEFGAECLKAHL